MSRRVLQGLVAAVFTPMLGDGKLNLGRVAPMVDHLLGDGVGGLFVCGTTGEGPSLSRQEREATAQAYVEAAAGRVPVAVQVGHNCLQIARRLAAHAREIGADAISAAPPCYFKPPTVEALVQCLVEVTAGAPELPFYYYHIPSVTGVDLDMLELLQAGRDRLPTLAGLKFSCADLEKLRRCREFDSGRFDVLFGVDDMYLSGLEHAVCGAVGSTYNFAAPLYRGIARAFEEGQLEEAKRLQELAKRMIETIFDRCGQAGLKAAMELVGVGCGPSRLPLLSPDGESLESLRIGLNAIGFFDWARGAE